jgi:hypothetical protein
MSETKVSYHTLAMKQQFQQWLEKGKPGLFKARVHANWTKQNLFAFFDSKGPDIHTLRPGLPLSTLALP